MFNFVFVVISVQYFHILCTLNYSLNYFNAFVDQICRCCIIYLIKDMLLIFNIKDKVLS